MPSHEFAQEAPFIEKLNGNKMFREIAEPVTAERFPEIKDAELVVRKDGIIFDIEGWYHPEGKVIGEVMYIPDTDGSKDIFGQRYRKATLYPGTYTPVPYADRGALLSQYDPSLDQSSQNPFFAKYKQIIDRSDIVAHLPAQSVFRKLIQSPEIDTTHFTDDIMGGQRLLGVDFNPNDIGLTGAPLLGNIEDVHDVDIVFNGDLQSNLSLAKRMREFTRENPDKRVIEGGKGWNIRYYNERGSLMCNFFTYKNPDDAPLREFSMDVLVPDVLVEATVTDDTHSMYTPTVLGLTGVIFEDTDTDVKEVDIDSAEDMKLIAYHTATRGECFAKDRIKARGALVNVKTPNEEYRAICVIEREGIRNLTPNWEGFYQDNIGSQGDTNEFIIFNNQA